jgi:hypothetical protein
MNEDNVRMTSGEFTRWVVLALLLGASLTAYFVYAPRVPPAIHPAPPVTEQ